MKLTKKTLIAAVTSTMLVLSTQAFATDVTNTNGVIKTIDTSSKAAAYELALTKLNVLEASSSLELDKNLGTISFLESGSTLNDGSYITVLEKMNANGEIVYEGLVHVSISY